VTNHSVPSPPAEAIPLVDAFTRFAPADLLSEYHRKTAERRGLPRRPTFHRESDNTIARMARAVQADLHRLLRRIKQSLIDQLIAGDLVGYGQTDAPFGPWRQIPAATWRGYRITDIRRGVASGPSVDLLAVHIAPARAANHPAQPSAKEPPAAQTGVPGRPEKHISVVIQEFERQAKAGRIAPSLAQQARGLAEWFQTAHPDKQAPTPKTIENRLRAQYREAVRRMEYGEVQ
jgi:hypothetical protein